MNDFSKAPCLWCCDQNRLCLNCLYNDEIWKTKEKTVNNKKIVTKSKKTIHNTNLKEGKHGNI
jgi:hypothetical protein